MQKFVHVEPGEELDYYVVGAVRCKPCVGQLCTSDKFMSRLYGLTHTATML